MVQPGQSANVKTVATTSGEVPLARAHCDRGRTGQSITGVHIAATGVYVPETIVRNTDLSALGCDDDWIVQRTGIHERRHARTDQGTCDLAWRAASNCLDSAGFSADHVDLIIVCTATPDYLAPSTASLVQGRLQTAAATMEVNVGCAGFIHGLTTGSLYVAHGGCQAALVIGAETLSRRITLRDPKTYPIFGDGAGAVLLTRSQDDASAAPSGILAYRLGADGRQHQTITMAKRGACGDAEFVQMDGRAVFKWAVNLIPPLILRTLESAGLTRDDIDLFILHQANLRIIEAVRERLGVESSRVYVNVDRYGNTSSASIPLALDEACRGGFVSRRSRVLMCGFGAGLNWGACVFQGLPDGSQRLADASLGAKVGRDR